jgi:hypothetical protein
MKKQEAQQTLAALRTALVAVCTVITEQFSANIKEDEEAKRSAGTVVVLTEDAEGYQKGVIGVETGCGGRLAVGDKVGETVNSDKVAPATAKQIVKAVGKLSDNAVTRLFTKISTQVYSANAKQSIVISAEDESDGAE